MTVPAAAELTDDAVTSGVVPGAVPVAGLRKRVHAAVAADLLAGAFP